MKHSTCLMWENLLYYMGLNKCMLTGTCLQKVLSVRMLGVFNTWLIDICLFSVTSDLQFAWVCIFPHGGLTIMLKTMQYNDLVSL